MPDYKINEQLANEQLEELYDYYDVDDEIMEAEGGEQDSLGIAVRVQRHQMIIKLRKGRFEVQSGEDGLRVIQHLRREVSGKNELTWKEPDGIAKIELDKQKAGDNQRLFAFVGYLTGVGATKAKTLRGPDLSTAELLATFFMRA